MAETPVGIFPDLPLAYDITTAESHLTQVQTAWAGREQRRGQFPATGYRRFTASSASLDQVARGAVKDFLRGARGRLGAFNYWNPAPESFVDVAAGTASAQARIIIPYRVTNPLGTANGSLIDVRVAGLTQNSFTNRHLLPRPTTYNALRFDGNAAATSFINAGSSATLRPNAQIALSAWVWLAGDGMVSGGYIATNEIVNASGTVFFINGSRNVLFRTNQAGANTSGTSSFAIPLETWTHIVVSRSAGQVIFYMNGGAASNTVSGIADPVIATIPFDIGGTGSLAINGMLSDVRFHAGTISAAEALNLYNNGTPTPSVALRGWWKLTEGTGASVADSSGNGNTGTVNGSPTWVSGEEEVQFGSNQTGAVTVTGTLRDRLIARSDSDSLSNRFLMAAPILSIHDIRIKEVY